MGGPGSSRWTMTLTRLTTEGLLRLDVRALERVRCLVPDAVTTVTWNTGASVRASVSHDDPACIMVEYDVVDHRLGRRSVTESFPLLTTPGTLGGRRTWFGCPGCGTRCAVLYALGDCFRCRRCHHLAYASTRSQG